MTDEWLSVSRVSDRTGIPGDELLRAIFDGELPRHHDQRGIRLQLRVVDVEAWAAKHPQHGQHGVA